jgi:hypothetical protein
MLNQLSRSQIFLLQKWLDTFSRCGRALTGATLLPQLDDYAGHYENSRPAR